MKESDQKRPLAVSDITLFYRFTVLHTMRLFTSFRPAFENVDAFPLQNFALVQFSTLCSSKPTQTSIIAFLFCSLTIFQCLLFKTFSHFFHHLHLQTEKSVHVRTLISSSATGDKILSKSVNQHENFSLRK